MLRGKGYAKRGSDTRTALHKSRAKPSARPKQSVPLPSSGFQASNRSGRRKFHAYKRSIAVLSPRLSRNIKSRRRLRKRLATGFEPSCLQITDSMANSPPDKPGRVLVQRNPYPSSIRVRQPCRAGRAQEQDRPRHACTARAALLVRWSLSTPAGD